MEQQYLICGGQSLCILGIPIIRHHYSVIGLLMCPRCGNLLNGFIPHRQSVELALERYTNTIFFGYNVNALVTALHRHTCIPSDTAQLVGAECLKLVRSYVVRKCSRCSTLYTLPLNSAVNHI